MLKTASSITNALGALVYQGTWDASTNNPTLTSSVGVKGYYYVVSVAGTTNLNGISLWSIGDWAVFNGTAWQKVDGGTSEAYVNLTVSGTANIATANVANFVSANVIVTGGNVAANIAGSYGLPSANVTGLGTMATQNANAVTITGGTFSGTNVAVSNGVLSTNQFNGAYSDGTVVDYTPTNGRISVGIADTLTFYAGGPGNVATGNVTATGTWNLPNVSANLALSTSVPVANAVGTLSVSHGGTGVTTSTGSGNVVLSTSPNLTTPVLGTPTSGNLSNCTNIPVANATGTLAVANGGTGVTSSTGSGKVVLDTNPTVSGLFAQGGVIAGDSANGVVYLRNLSSYNRIDSYNWPITGTYPLDVNASQIRFFMADSLKSTMFTSGGVSIGNTTDPGAGNLNVNGTGKFGGTTQASNALFSARMTLTDSNATSGISSAAGTTATLAQNATANTYTFPAGYAGVALIVVTGADPNTAWRAAAICWCSSASITVASITSSNITVGSSGTTITLTNTSASSIALAWSVLRLS